MRQPPASISGRLLPRAVAAAVTLALGAVLSLVLFSVAERPVATVLKKRDAGADAAGVRHVMFSLAAFAAFIAFYSFAGAPTLRLVSSAPHFFQLLVVITATLFLVRRIGRRQRDFSEETLARTIIAKWPWTDAPPPRDLHEAFLIHSIRSKAHGEHARAGVLNLYKDAVRESVNSGAISHADVRGFDSVRSGLRITEADHERVMSELVEEDRARTTDGNARPSPEKHLQLEGYARALAACLDVAASTGRAVDDAVIQRLRNEYAVTADEHRFVLDSLVQRRDGVASYILDAPAAIEELAATIRAIEPAQSPVTAFLSRLLKRRWTRTVDTFLQALATGDEQTALSRDALLSSDPARRQPAIADLGTRLSPTTAARLTDAINVRPAPCRRMRRRHAGRSCAAPIPTFAPRRCTSCSPPARQSKPTVSSSPMTITRSCARCSSRNAAPGPRGYRTIDAGENDRALLDQAV